MQNVFSLLSVKLDASFIQIISAVIPNWKPSRASWMAKGMDMVPQTSARFLTQKLVVSALVVVCGNK